MDPVLGKLPPPHYNEKEIQRKRNNEAEKYKIMRRLTIALVFLIWIIFFGFYGGSIIVKSKVST